MNAIECKNLDLFYGDFHALKGISASIAEKRITAMIGPSGCGKSTLLRVFNRMNDPIPGVRVTGDIRVMGRPMQGIGVLKLRRSVGMVFQRPNPFPFSVFDNVAYGMKVHGIGNREEVEEAVRSCLAGVGLWDDLKGSLKANALSLSGEQQQRLCIARVLAVKPKILLMDEPCSALDPSATARIEELMQDLKRDYAIVIVTHNMQQAARVSEDCGFMLMGNLVEFGKTGEMFTAPKNKETEDYISGRYG